MLCKVCVAVVLDVENSLDVLRYNVYEGFYAHFRTRATAVPCMQNMCTHVCMKDQEILL